MALVDETRKERCEVAATAKKEAIDCYIRPSFMYKILGKSVCRQRAILWPGDIRYLLPKFHITIQ